MNLYNGYLVPAMHHYGAVLKTFDTWPKLGFLSLDQSLFCMGKLNTNNIMIMNHKMHNYVTNLNVN